jgi:hypothetical protein
MDSRLAMTKRKNSSERAEVFHRRMEKAVRFAM